MGYSLEPLCENYYLVRIGKKHYKYGDPYEVSFILKKIDKRALIKGASGKLKAMKDIVMWARECGYEEIAWERLKNGKIKEVSVRLPKKTS